MPPTITDDLSKTAIQIESRRDDMVLATGTAFAYVHSGRSFAITARHNVTGRSPKTDEPSHSTGGTPTSLGLWLSHAQGGMFGQWKIRSVDLYDKEDQPLWYEHPILHRFADVVAIPLPTLEGAHIWPANDNIYTRGQDLGLSPGIDAFVLGFPYEITGGDRLPLWRRGSIASEPNFHFFGLPINLIDIVGRKGMSGAPVFAQGPIILGTSNGIPTLGIWRRFLGCYSGRFDPPQQELPETLIGMVWKASSIDEIVCAQQRASHPDSPRKEVPEPMRRYLTS